MSSCPKCPLVLAAPLALALAASLSAAEPGIDAAIARYCRQGC